MKYISNPGSKWLLRLLAVGLLAMNLYMAYFLVKTQQYTGLFLPIIFMGIAYFISYFAVVKYDKQYIRIEMIKGTYEYDIVQLIDIKPVNTAARVFAIRFTDGSRYLFPRGSTRVLNDRDLGSEAIRMEKELRSYIPIS